MQSAKTGQTVQMCRLISVFAGPTSLIVGFVVCWLFSLISPQKHMLLILIRSALLKVPECN